MLLPLKRRWAQSRRRRENAWLMGASPGNYVIGSPQSLAIARSLVKARKACEDGKLSLELLSFVDGNEWALMELRSGSERRRRKRAKASNWNSAFRAIP